jgi:hypothetical protein
MDVPVNRQEEIIQTINSLSQEKRAAFWKSAKEIILSTGTYVYKETETTEKKDWKDVKKTEWKYVKK